ncbi:MAG: peptidase T [Candidatus Heimdallarchaeota archaeon]|nr:peptidase T [Candidatus Heimdallarchaeota archaeon]MBY8994357.1 peptidase T [Candidatus Heimdallarchaeota archaeon]
MEITKEIQAFLLEEGKNRFLKYVKIDTTSDEGTGTFPSTEKQFDLGKILVNELKELGFENVTLDEFCFVYGDLPASKGYDKAQPIGLLAHMDTSPAESGANIEPIIHEKYDGKPIIYTKNPDITLTMQDSPLLEKFKGMDIITSSGDTLLGADDKAGIAGIMAAAAAWYKYPELKHGPLTVCFTPDEEIGHGTTKINMDRLPKFCYTFDGGEMGELEIECFDAWSATITFNGISVHPGYAKNLMVNAIEIASRFVAQIPEAETPQHRENREGFYHLYKMEGDCVKAKTVFILRDFKKENNQKRMKYLEKLKIAFVERYPGLKINLDFKHSYENMLVYLEEHAEVIQKAAEAIKMADLELHQTLIRGGTDGARLSARGIPTPNLFAGGVLFHSLKEYIPIPALQKSAEVILYLAKNWME